VGEFSIDIAQFHAETIEDIDIIRRKTTLDVFSKVVFKTPVDTGRARGNWSVSISKPSRKVLKGVDRTGQKVQARIATSVGRSSVTDSVFLANNLPYIGVLEYGGYPMDPEKGSRISIGKAKGQYEIRSAGGFSKQAPAGMVRTTIAEFPYIVRKSEAGTKFSGG